MDFRNNTKEISDKDKARPPEQSEEISAERRNDNNESSTTA